MKPKRNPPPTVERVRELFHYCQVTGDLYRLTSVKGSSTLKPIRSPDSNGSYRVSIDGVRYAAHRIIWLWNYGTFPDVVDHKDGDRTNNRLDNLRKATYSQNSQNRIPKRVKQKSKYKGVTQRKSGKWTARIQIKGCRRELGSFISEEEAGKAYQRAAKNIFGEFDVHNRETLRYEVQSEREHVSTTDTQDMEYG